MNKLACLMCLSLVACDAQVSNTTNATVNNYPAPTSTTPAPITASVDAILDAPYSYAGTLPTNAGCWESRVRTNGPSYGAIGNSGYYCTGGGASYSNPPNAAYPNDSTWIGFYRDGTISLRDPSGNDGVFNALLPMFRGLNCELDLSRSSDSANMYVIARVNYPGFPDPVLDQVLDSQDHLQYMEVQSYLNPGVDNALDSGSIWTCEYRSDFGVQ